MKSGVYEKSGQDKRVLKILRWRESLTLLPDNRFFDIVRTYLGPIKTPYNKQNLVEQLSSIFRKEQNQRRIISFLSECDFQILSLISLLPFPTQDNVKDFFQNRYDVSVIYSALLNLSERLLIYSYSERGFSEAALEINPLVEDALKTFLGIAKIFPKTECVQKNQDSSFCISPIFLASYISFIRANPEMSKNDLSIKKKYSERLENIFLGKSETPTLLLNSFFNIGIVRFKGKSLCVDDGVLEKFAELPEIFQYVYLAVASAENLGREGFLLYGQLLLELLNSVPKEGFVFSSLTDAAFILSNRNDGTKFSERQERFSKIERIRLNAEIVDFMEKDFRTERPHRYSGKIIEKIVRNAISLGLFSVYGKTSSGEDIFVPAEIFIGGENVSMDSKKGLLNINAGTSITLMPGFSLSELVPLMDFMNIVKSGTVAEFEITRKSASRAFDKNIVPEQIFSLLQKYDAYEIPQNLRMNIEEWHKTFSSAVVYKGYVLKLDEKTSRILENNPKAKSFIQTKLGEGIYLLNIPLDDDFSKFSESVGLEFMGNVKNPEIGKETLPFPLLQSARKLDFENTAEQNAELLEELLQEGNKTKAQYFRTLKSLGLTKQQENALALRIEKGIIISQEQLRAENVRLEILETDGMNYAGKIRMIENAILSGALLELSMPNDNEASKMNNFLGKPISLSKRQDDCILKFRLEQSGEIRLFSVGMANKIKLVKTSIFD